MQICTSKNSCQQFHLLTNRFSCYELGTELKALYRHDKQTTNFISGKISGSVNQSGGINQIQIIYS